MFEIFRKKKNNQEGVRYQRNVIPDWMGYPRTDFSRYDPYGEEKWSPERKSIHALEGAGRKGWDSDQNRGYRAIYGDVTPQRFPNHQGKGPRNYQRPDERIEEDIFERLSNEWQLDSSEVDVKVKSGIVYLAGKVKDRTVRHRVEDLAEAVKGVRNVENNIRVS